MTAAHARRPARRRRGPTSCGTVTSGGTESILLAMKTYRDHARAARGVTDAADGRPRSPRTPRSTRRRSTSASSWCKVPVGAGLAGRRRRDRGRRSPTDTVVDRRLGAVRSRTGSSTRSRSSAAIAAGARHRLPHRRLPRRLRAAVGGAARATPVPPFDFRVPGVTSMSAATRTSSATPPRARRSCSTATPSCATTSTHRPRLARRPVLLPDVRRPPPGSAERARLGGDGRRSARRATSTATRGDPRDRGGHARGHRRRSTGSSCIGDPLCVVAFGPTERDLDIYRVLDAMSHHGWSLNGLQRPAGGAPLRDAAPHAAGRRRAVRRRPAPRGRAGARPTRPAAGRMAPVYGMAASVDGRGTVEDILRTYVDVLFRV